MSIVIENISKELLQPDRTFKKVLDNITVDIPDNRLTILIGKNGCGKSTLLNSIAGLRPFDSGNISVNTESGVAYDLSASKNDPFIPKEIRKDIGVIFQHKALWNYLSIIENITHPLKKVFEMSRSEAKDRAIEWLKKVGINEKSYDKFPIQLSGGEQRKVAIARTLATDHKILLIDEIEANLDQEALEKILNLLEVEYIQPGKTIIAISHRVDLLEKYSPNVLLMDNGKLIYEAKNVKRLMEDNRSTENFSIINEVIDPSGSQWFFANRCLETAREISELNIKKEFKLEQLFTIIGSQISNLISELEPKNEHMSLIATKEEYNANESANLRVRSINKTKKFQLNGKDVLTLPKQIRDSETTKNFGTERTLARGYENKLENESCFLQSNQDKKSALEYIIDNKPDDERNKKYKYSPYSDELDDATCIVVNDLPNLNDNMYYEFCADVKYVYLIRIRVKDENNRMEIKGAISIDTTSSKKWPNSVMERLLLIANMAAIAIKQNEQHNGA